MGKTIKLHGGITYHLFGIDEGTHSDKSSKERFEKTKLGDYSWMDSTKLLANFNDNLSGSNYNGSFGDVDRFEICKSIGDGDKLHEVCTTQNSYQKIVEDFTVGDLCNYRYHIFPICKDTAEIEGKTVNIETVSPIISDDICIHSNIISITGVINNGNNSYSIDENNIWHLQLNVSNDGYTLNTDKTFYQTQSTYGKASGGNRKQRSIPISGLLGKIDCGTGEYLDTFDHILDWETFAASNSLKMLIDLRGVITLGDIDVNPSFSYAETQNHEASVSFTFTQLNSIDNISVLGRVLPINPVERELLKDNNRLILQDTNILEDKSEYNECLSSPLEDN